MEPLRIGVNGLGRIGRLVLRHAVRRALDPDGLAVARSGRSLQIVAINDIATPEQIAYLVSHDSVHPWHGPWAEVDGGAIHFGPMQMKVFCEPNPEEIPWGDRGVELVLECTGRFRTRDALRGHLDRPGGPRKVVVSAPGEVDRTIVVGVNEDALDREKDRLISCASCTTNAVAPVLAILDGVFGVRWGLVGTVHAYTGSQGTVDGAAGKDLRRGRTAAVNLIPTATGAAKATVEVLPGLDGRIAGSAVRVPVADGSLFDVTCTLDGSPSLDRVLGALRDASETGTLRRILDVRDEPLVSTDIIDDPHSSIVDVGASLAQGPLVKIVGWYDNECAYAARLLDLVTVAAGPA